MKRFILIVTLALSVTALFGQTVRPGMTYKELKQVYNTKSYQKTSTDPFSPFWLGLTSFAEPGVGQLIAHEPGRGWAFIGGDFLIGLVGGYGIRTVYNSIEKDADGNIIKEDNKIVFLDEKAAKKGAYIFAGAALANLVLRIWSCSDAVKIAKVKNMYNQDLMGRYATATMYPSVDFVQTGSGYKPTAGMTFAVRF